MKHVYSTAFRSEGCSNCLSFHWPIYGERIIWQYIPVFQRIVSHNSQVIYAVSQQCKGSWLISLLRRSLILAETVDSSLNPVKVSTKLCLLLPPVKRRRTELKKDKSKAHKQPRQESNQEKCLGICGHQNHRYRKQ